MTGRIYIVEGGGIADDSDLEVDFTYGDHRASRPSAA